MIQCKIQHNIPCLKCGALNKEMVRVGGTIIMCKKCYKEEFHGIIEIDAESKIGKKYYKWLKVQRKRYII